MSTFFQQTAQANAFAKKPFSRQPKPKNRFSAVGRKAFLQRSLFDYLWRWV
ncbi:hypothetical protein [Neisseria mucosa]|uniref:hypothetical protein n=1 Tax=Neisseria mucosa TaxID=488 RepID=UPI0018775E8D|nr:hypothetical protein [Neisseria mucosa]